MCPARRLAARPSFGASAAEETAPFNEAFAWWIQQDQLGKTFFKLTELRAAELKSVIDTAAPLNELEWSQPISDYPLSRLARTYTMVRYRPDRIAKNDLTWPDATYRLNDILGAGGICVDQAYFAAETGKARSVPTLLFRGEGNSGRHAWFGFLDAERTGQPDAGRVGEQRFMTGIAYDPQTWSGLSEHELRFLAERFRETPAFRQSRIHAEFSRAFLLAGEDKSALVAAHRAIDLESRNQIAWDTLLAALSAAGHGAPELEAALRDAQRTFERYPDREALYANRLAASWRGQGETAAAELVELRVGSKNQGSRNDLSVQQARGALLRAVAAQDLPEQIRVYESAVDTAGRAGGIVFFDQVVTGLAAHLKSRQQTAAAMRAVERAQRTLEIAPGSQLEQEFGRLLKNLKIADDSNGPQDLDSTATIRGHPSANKKPAHKSAGLGSEQLDDQAASGTAANLLRCQTRRPMSTPTKSTAMPAAAVFGSGTGVGAEVSTLMV